MKYRLKEIRELKNMSVEELSEKSGVSRNWIWKIESGRAENVSVKILLALAGALDTRMDDLFILEN